MYAKNFFHAFARRHPFFVTFGLFFMFIFLTAESCEDSVDVTDVDLPAVKTDWSWVEDGFGACPAEVELDEPPQCAVKVWHGYTYTSIHGTLELSSGEVLKFSSSVDFDTQMETWYEGDYAFVAGPGHGRFNPPSEQYFDFYWYTPTGVSYADENITTSAETAAQIEEIKANATATQVANDALETEEAAALPSGVYHLDVESNCYLYPSRTGFANGGGYYIAQPGDYLVWYDGKGDWGIQLAEGACYLP